jgi:hypothetical protein
MSYTVVMLTFMEDAAVTHRLKDSFPSMEAAKEAGAREIAVRGARAEINRMAEHRKRPRDLARTGGRPGSRHV